MSAPTQRSVSQGPSAKAEIARLLLAPYARAALVVAHPAHELRLHHWMGRAKPWTFILTSGSGSGEDLTRLAASAEVIAISGARFMDQWAAVRDIALYEQILEGDATQLVDLTKALADSFVVQNTSIVVADSWQHYNVAHDLAHVMARKAAALASRSLGRNIPVVDYPVIPYGLVPNALKGETVLELRLGQRQADMRIAAIRAIPFIEHEVEGILTAEGANALLVEQFNLPLPISSLSPGATFKPYYEQFGEERVRSGTYIDVIRSTHMKAILVALSNAFEIL